MGSIDAFARGESARASGNKYKIYDYEKAIKLIEEAKPKEASLGISEEWSWTAAVVYEDGKFVMDLKEEPDIAGIKGSIWGTPTLEMDGDSQDCWKYESED